LGQFFAVGGQKKKEFVEKSESVKKSFAGIWGFYLNFDVIRANQNL
jgi:hypothetical protein